jgi:glycosyltransferase involved in cell wall biosynthesis
MVSTATNERPSAETVPSGVDPSIVWVVIPSYNDEAAIDGVLASLQPYGYSVVVVDDGSKRRLADHLASRWVHLCRHLVNLGQGAALQTGIDYALLHGAEYVVTFDADGQHCAEDIPRLVAVLASGEYDIALGSRFLPGGRVEKVPRKKLLMLRGAVLFTRLLVGLPLTDTHNGLRALTAGAACSIRITQNRMSHATQILQQVAAKRLRYKEVPVTIRYTDYSIRKGQALSNALNILWESAVEAFH